MLHKNETNVAATLIIFSIMIQSDFIADMLTCNSVGENYTIINIPKAIVCSR